MQPLTHLRSLAVTDIWPRPSFDGFQELMNELNKLPQLQHLQLCDTHGTATHPSLSAAAHLPTLRCADNLTHLACGLHLVEWDDAAINTLSSGLPRLSSLALNIGRPDEAAPDPTATILQAISRRTALMALDLNLENHVGDPCSFEALASLRLASCRMQLSQDCDTTSLLEALSVQRSLTQLRLDGLMEPDGAGVLTSACLQHLTRMADTLVQLDLQSPVDPAANLLEAVGKLTNLRALRLAYMPGAQAAAWVTSDVTCLAQLRSLEVLDLADNAGGFVAAVVGSVSELVGLKELTLCGPRGDNYDTDTERNNTQYITDNDLWRLLPLQPHLTRLVLADLIHVVEPGFAALRLMAGLQLLEVVNMAVESLHLHLLPLPPSLRSIRLYPDDDRMCAEAVSKLREAGRKQDCTLARLGSSDQWFAALQE